MLTSGIASHGSTVENEERVFRGWTRRRRFDRERIQGIMHEKINTNERLVTTNALKRVDMV